jgi:hypothetical protein
MGDFRGNLIEILMLFDKIGCRFVDKLSMTFASFMKHLLNSSIHFSIGKITITLFNNIF